ncbi:hypothetical protein CHCC20441_0039 [Bacillus licheniformis]|uniref:Uncharacterized protein n=1 Tax=Bacillus licheniformis TaxID=1402 RepID=A0A8B5YHR0_BACLI|nr:hypothetical protein B4092_4676 [Bacillus licheniformis]TWN11560.1 hypothetical protein CHCC14564_4112 [Bacillus licheniformis LMG 17339]TWJ42867.1 hypothetical protein CHCC5026_0986 [Bacillus licheniformis]TWJ44577.1 hypothetical protein CHCC5025_2145 [Bacillus licheniformis]TWJ50991.1 hypothetical protein CHCC5024_2765 [Bacillus licheniformis]
MNKFLSFLYFNKKRIGRLLFLSFCFLKEICFVYFSTKRNSFFILEKREETLK